MNLNIAIKIAIGLAGYIAWAIMAFLDVTLRADFLHFNIAMAMGTIGLVLRDMQPPAQLPAPPVDKQGGRVLPGFLLVLAAVISMLLSGCASFQQAVNGYESAAGVAIAATDDNLVRVWTFQACATPISAAIRNPQIIPALRVLCLPAGAASPGSLLDTVPVQP